MTLLRRKSVAYSLLSAICCILITAHLILCPPPLAAQPDRQQRHPDHVVAVIPADAPPTYYRDHKTGRAAGYSVDIMDAVAERAGLHVNYVFGNGWSNIINTVERGDADLAPLMGISEERRKKFAFTMEVDAFPIVFFIHAHKVEKDWTPENKTVGVISGSLAHEKLRNRPDLHIRMYEGFEAGMHDLLSGKISAFACPSPIFLQIARDAGIVDHFVMIDPPIDIIHRSIAVRKDNVVLLERLNKALEEFVGSEEYQHIYRRWYGEPQPFWTLRRVIEASAVTILLTILIMAGWRYWSVMQLNRKLSEIIAERQQAEATLVKWGQIFEHARWGITVGSADGKSTELMNPEFARMHGYSVEELMRLPIVDLFSPECRKDVPEQIRIAHEKGHYLWESRHLRKDGSTFPVLIDVTTVRDELGEIRFRVVNVQDITERKRFEEELWRSEKKLRDITSCQGEGLYVIDNNGLVTFMNPEAERLLGWSEAELRGRNIHDLVHNRRPDGSYLSFEDCPMHAVIATGDRFVSRDETFTSRDGRTFPVSIISTPLREDHRIVGSITSFLDISEHKRLEQEREKLIADLQKALAEIRTLHGILPICSFCKKIRDDKGAWQQMESYISAHTDALFSHGLCQECAKKMYPAYYKDTS